MKQTYTFESAGADATEACAEEIGFRLKGGEVIELIGDVGAGKTTFVRGLARGIASSDAVSSPTFTLCRVYGSANLSIHHYDFYRLEDFTIIARELAEVLQDPKNVVVLEWANQLQQALPIERISINIKATGETKRQLQFALPDKHNYLKVGNA